MSSFKTPTAISPPKKQNSNPQPGRPTDIMHPYDATPTLLQAFEQFKSREPDSKEAARSLSATLPVLSTVEQASVVNRARPNIDRASSATFPPSSTVREGKLPHHHRLVLDRTRTATNLPLSNIRLNNIIGCTRSFTAPLLHHHDWGSLNDPSRATTSVNTPLSSYGRISSTVGGDLLSNKPLPLPPPCPDLEVYKRHESNGRLMVCEAREQHCSSSVKDFMGEQTGLSGIEELKEELLRIIGHLGEGSRELARANLKVVTVSMPSSIPGMETMLTL